MTFRTAAVVIGVNRAPGQAQLHNAEHDAQDLAAFLRGPLAPVAPENVLLVVGPQATKSRIASVFRIAASRRPDLLFVVFSGHGDAGSICLVDGLLDHRTLAGWITLVGATRGAVIIDACHAGAFASQFGFGEVSGLPDDNWQNLLTRMLPGMRLLLASRSNQLSSDGEGRNGTFTAALLEAFQHLPGEVEYRGRSYITAESAFRHAAALVRKRSGGEQTPVVHGCVADFPIARQQSVGVRRRPARHVRPLTRPQPTARLGADARAGAPAGHGFDIGTTLLGLLVVGGAAYAWSRRSAWDSNVGRYRGPDGRFR